MPDPEHYGPREASGAASLGARRLQTGHWFALAAAVAAVLFLTLTLRVPTTSVGPVLPAIGADTGFSSPALGMLTSVPLLCFLIVAPATPALARKLGTGRLLVVALAGAAAGTLVRSLPGDASIWAGTVLLGVAAAVVSVLAPAAVRTLGSERRGWLTALYTATLSLGPAMAAGLTVPLAGLLGGSWRGALAIWAVLPVLAIICWTLSRTEPAEPEPTAEDPSAAEPTVATSSASGPSASGRTADVGLWDVLRDPAAWGIAAFLGMSSLLFYTMTAWLPSILMEFGSSAAGAGATAALVNIVAIPSSFAAPMAVRRSRARWVPPVLAPLPIAGGAVLLAIAPEATTVAAVLLGIGQGASVGIAYALVLLTARSTAHATAVSSMSQTVGVTLAALGPVGIAAIHDATGGWTAAILTIAALAMAQAGLGAVISRRTSSPER